MEQVEQKLERILEQLEALDKRIERLETSAENMDSHIDFVGGIYARVEAPFNRLMQFTRQHLGGATDNVGTAHEAIEQ